MGDSGTPHSRSPSKESHHHSSWPSPKGRTRPFHPSSPLPAVPGRSPDCFQVCWLYCQKATYTGRVREPCLQLEDLNLNRKYLKPVDKANFLLSPVAYWHKLTIEGSLAEYARDLSCILAASIRAATATDPTNLFKLLMTEVGLAHVMELRRKLNLGKATWKCLHVAFKTI